MSGTTCECGTVALEACADCAQPVCDDHLYASADGRRLCVDHGREAGLEADRIRDEAVREAKFHRAAALRDRRARATALATGEAWVAAVDWASQAAEAWAAAEDADQVPGILAMPRGRFRFATFLRVDTTMRTRVSSRDDQVAALDSVVLGRTGHVALISRRSADAGWHAEASYGPDEDLPPEVRTSLSKLLA
ncbi:MAG TPA: hypothetical protein VGO19_09480 [Actinomycetes bacterium]|jgi:hypothetical protein